MLTKKSDLFWLCACFWMILLLKHWKEEISVKKIFQNFVFHVISHKLYEFITCSGLFFVLVQAKYLIRVHNLGQINVLIGMHCSNSLGFCFKNHEWQLTLGGPKWRLHHFYSQEKHKLKNFPILLSHLKELNGWIKNNIKAMSIKSWDLVWRIQTIKKWTKYWLKVILQI